MRNPNRLYWLKQEIKDLEKQIKELSSLRGSMMSGMPSSRAITSSVEQCVLKIEKLEEKLTKKRLEYIAETERIEAFIENIEDDEIRLIARKRFIDHKNFETIGNEMYIDRTTASKKLTRYLERNNIQ